MERFRDLDERKVYGNYDVHVMHHYTTLAGLSGILHKGYIEARESKGDSDFGDMIKNHKAVSFLDGNYDNELSNVCKQNDRGGTLEGYTFHLGLHQKTVCALVEIDLDKLPEDNEVELLESITGNALRNINEWNESAYDGAKLYHNWKTLYDTKMEMHNNKDCDDDKLKSTLLEKGVEQSFMDRWGRECKFREWGEKFPDYDQEYIKGWVNRAEKGKDIVIEKLTDEEADLMKKAVNEINPRLLYKMMRKKGVPQRWFDEAQEKHRKGFPRSTEESDSSPVNSLVNFIYSAMGRTEKPFIGPTFEMRIPENIPLTQDNCRIHIFKNMIQKETDKARVDKILDYNNKKRQPLDIRIVNANEKPYLLSKE